MDILLYNVTGFIEKLVTKNQKVILEQTWQTPRPVNRPLVVLPPAHDSIVMSPILEVDMAKGD